ncbi:MAG: hypothetical protein ACI4O5_04445 [Oscillospiraceae bacterium]
MPNSHPWPDYIIRKGFFLSGVLLACALVLSVWASAVPAAFPLLRRYAAYYQSCSAAVLAAALLGSLLLEDILRKKPR